MSAASTMNSNTVHSSNQGSFSEDALGFSTVSGKLCHEKQLLLTLLELVTVDGLVGLLFAGDVGHGVSPLVCVCGSGVKLVKLVLD